MIRILTLLASVAAIAGPAAAAEVHISMIGKDAGALHKEVVAAANAVCAEAFAAETAYRPDVISARYQMDACIDAAVKGAYAQMPTRAVALQDQAATGAFSRQ